MFFLDIGSLVIFVGKGVLELLGDLRLLVLFGLLDMFIFSFKSLFFIN